MQLALSRSRRMPLPISICHGRCEPTHGCGAQVDRLGDHALACPRTGLLARSGSAVERESVFAAASSKPICCLQYFVVLPSSALLDDACVRRSDKQVRQWGRRLLGWPAGAPRAAVLGELGWACFPWKSERPKQACLGVFVQLTAWCPSQSCCSRFPLCSRYSLLLGASSSERLEPCGYTLAVIVGHLLVGKFGNTDLPGRPWISLAPNFVRRKWHSFALCHYSICVIPVSTFAL